MTDKQKEIIKATVPILREHGTSITTHFYQDMFNAHPELLNIFNKTNQKVGNQPKALANTVLAAAKHIDNLEAITPAVVSIAHKHRALNVTQDQYSIVGHHLIKAIKFVLGDDATPEIIDAWETYYNEISKVFIDVEQKMYNEARWQGFKPFKVIDKKALTNEIVQFTVKNDDVVPDFKAGQYITVKVQPENYGNDALRHYSLSAMKNENNLQFTVKREGENDKKGIVSHFLHDNVNVDDYLELSAPAGDFTLNPEHKKILFVAGGIGITPIMAMLEEAVQSVKDISLIYSVKNASHHPYLSRLKDFTSNVDVKVKYTSTEGRLNKFDFEGFKDHHVYLCGSMDFMQNMLNILVEIGVPKEHIYFEPFGPKMSLLRS